LSIARRIIREGGKEITPNAEKKEQTNSRAADTRGPQPSTLAALGRTPVQSVSVDNQQQLNITFSASLYFESLPQVLVQFTY
jgi:hypothetical protein